MTTDEAKTTVSVEEIEAKLKLLKTLQKKISTINKVVRLIEQTDDESFKKLCPSGRFYADGNYINADYTFEAHLVACLLSKNHWQRQIPPLEKWLDDRNIEYPKPGA